MLNWLKDHVYVATWLGLVTTLVLTFVKAFRSQSPQIDWFRFLIYFSFFSCLGAAFTPAFDPAAREFARGFIYMLLGVIIVLGNRKLES